MKNIFLGVSIVLIIATLFIKESQFTLKITLDMIVIVFILASMFFKSKGKI